MSLNKLTNWMAYIASVCLVALAVLTMVDVIGRYFLGQPLTFSVEVTQLLMGIVVIFGVARTTVMQVHTSVDLLPSALPRSLQVLLRRISAVVGAFFFGVISWKLFGKAQNALRDGLETDILGLPIYPFIIVVSLAAAVSAIICIVLVFFQRAPAIEPISEDM